LRASAASGLRHIGDPKADTLLADTALGDDDSRVRAQALGALRYRAIAR
jgi:HEAT repeat protein